MSKGTKVIRLGRVERLHGRVSMLLEVLNEIQLEHQDVCDVSILKEYTRGKIAAIEQVMKLFGEEFPELAESIPGKVITARGDVFDEEAGA